ncbi:putative late blight resistance protein homolog R1B-23 [Salvia miltiorrhiza]|uniref:putative late blight resistance protein homolog R1B-23 n=1 Tax=Salvia miltiorrhiza TaxID=226208 RepID=UPI0025AD9A2F|nr:putative late blight resistance protein homolog R1B-23 [Salvia miltiorrhiza]
MAAAYAALASLSNMIDRLQRHPFPPISLDEKQVQSLTDNATFLEEFLQCYNSPFGQIDGADPLQIRIADAARATEAAIESYIARVVMLNGVLIDRGEEMVSDEEIGCEIEFNPSSYAKTDPGEEIVSEEETISHGEELNFRDQIFCGEELSWLDEIGSGEEIDREEELNWGDEIESEEEIDHVEEINCINFYQDLEQLVEEMDLIKSEAMEIVEEERGVQNQLQRSNQPQRSILGPFDARQSVMVGHDDVLLQVLDKLTGGRLDRRAIPIVGMGGIGKTTLAQNIYAHPLIKEHFDICAWATISQQYSIKDIVWKLLSQIKNECMEQLTSEMCEDEVGLALYKCLSGRRYLIVMDDVWSIEAWDKIQYFFPQNNTRSRVVVTTRLSNLGYQLDNNYGLEMKFLNQVDSWNLFSKTVFGERSCPPELEEIGKEIVENCRGLPLSIIVTGGLLRKFGHSQEWWKSIKRNINSMVNSENHDHCLKMLKMSYDHLPVYLKPGFLYMGVFEKDFNVTTLIQLWISEGFLKPMSGKSLETIGKEYLKELVARNLILVDKLGSIGNIKTYKIHDLVRDLAQKEAHEERFYDVLGLSSPRFINSQHCGMSPRWLVPSNECFPKNVSQVVNLRYFDVCAPWMPKFLSFVNYLWNLHTLIVSDAEWPRTAFDIWKMPQLRHVHFYQSNRFHLTHPLSLSSNIDIVVMENLQTLVGVTNFKCSEAVVKRIPNIKKLGIVYHKFKGVWPGGDYYCLKYLECFGKLESLHCKVDCTIPDHEKNLASPRSLLKCRCNDHLQEITFPHSLKKLSLRVSKSFHVEGILEKIGWLPFLEKLHLWGGYFRSSKWEIVEGQFPYLKYLSLNMCEHLECWTLEGSGLPRLEKLRLYLIGWLDEMPSEIGEISTLKSIELSSCTMSLVKSLKKIVEEQEELQGELHFHVSVSPDLVDIKALESLETPNFRIERNICSLM